MALCFLSAAFFFSFSLFSSLTLISSVDLKAHSHVFCPLDYICIFLPCMLVLKLIIIRDCKIAQRVEVLAAKT